MLKIALDLNYILRYYSCPWQFRYIKYMDIFTFTNRSIWSFTFEYDDLSLLDDLLMELFFDEYERSY